MIYECDKCGAALPPGVRACPKCGDPFEDEVPDDAEVPRRGFTAKAGSPTPARADIVITRPEPHPTYPWLDAPASDPQFEAPPAEPRVVVSSAEVVYLQTADVTITSSRAVFRSKTYSMSNITSVSMAAIQPDKSSGCACLVIGAIALGIALLMDFTIGKIFGGVLLVIGLSAMFGGKVKYMVRIGSASAESNALWAYDQDYIKQVVNAVNEAIIHRG